MENTRSHKQIFICCGKSSFRCNFSLFVRCVSFFLSFFFPAPFVASHLTTGRGIQYCTINMSWALVMDRHCTASCAAVRQLCVRLLLTGRGAHSQAADGDSEPSRISTRQADGRCRLFLHLRPSVCVHVALPCSVAKCTVGGMQLARRGIFCR